MRISLIFFILTITMLAGVAAGAILTIIGPKLKASEEEIQSKKESQAYNSIESWISVQSPITNKCYEIITFEYDGSSTYSTKFRLMNEIEC